MTLIVSVGKVGRRSNISCCTVKNIWVNGERLRLITKIGVIWLDSKRPGNLDFDLKVLLNPFSSKLSSIDAQKVVKEFEKFLQDINFKF